METARDALEKGNLAPAASKAIHAAINACDAALIWYTGERSQGALTQEEPSLEEAAGMVEAAQEILGFAARKLPLR